MESSESPVVARVYPPGWAFAVGWGGAMILAVCFPVWGISIVFPALPLSAIAAEIASSRLRPSIRTRQRGSTWVPTLIVLCPALLVVAAIAMFGSQTHG